MYADRHHGSQWFQIPERHKSKDHRVWFESQFRRDRSLSLNRDDVPRTIGECAINTVPVSTNQGFKNFVPFDDVDVEFLYYLLGTQTQEFISLCGGSTFLEIDKTQLAAYEVRLPSTKTEQTAISDVLSDMDRDVFATEAKLAKTRQIKQGMMQELLTGRTRLV